MTPPKASKPIILCVDDEKIILDSLEEQLMGTLAGEFDLELAESASEALEILDEVYQEGRRVAVIISDQIMPGIKGDQFLVDVHQRHPEIVKILLTGQASLEAVRNAINQARLYRYVTKPWEAHDLMMTVAEAGRSFVQRELLDQSNTMNELLRQLNEAQQQLSAELDSERLYHLGVELAVQVMEADQGFFLIDTPAGPQVLSGFNSNPLLNTALKQRVENENRILASELETRLRDYSELRKNPGFLAKAISRNDGLMIGHLVLENPQSRRPFDAMHVEMLNMLRAQLGVSLEKARLYNSLEAKTQELRLEKEKVEKFNHLLEEKTQDIIDSITYAKRIQTAFLPDLEKLRFRFEDSFVLYKPRDIVSGDFYWWAEQLDGSFLIAAVDCTGHGVPGAFMSVIANNLLNEVARNPKLTNMAAILAYMDRQLRSTLKQNTGELDGSLDGMDIAMLRFRPGTNQVQFAGANSPLLIVRNGELTQIEPTKSSVGGRRYTGEGRPRDTEFAEVLIDLQPGDRLYMHSDGYQDQFGGDGPTPRKFSRKRLHQVLLDHHAAPMETQQYIYTKTILDWKGEGSQLDDILLMGLHYKGVWGIGASSIGH